MGYRVDYKLLNAMYEQINSQTSAWTEELNAVKSALERLRDSQNYSGAGADSIRLYLESIHIELADTLLSVVGLHKTNFVLYKSHYQDQLDTGLETVIDEEELNTIEQALTAMKNAALDVDDNVRDILRNVKDIEAFTLRSVADVADVISDAVQICSNLDFNIKAIESRHFNGDFTETGATIQLLTNQINTYLGKSRSFKSNYTPDDSAKVLAQVNTILMSDLDGKAEAAKAAVESHESREELANRLEAAKWEKLLLSAAVVVASVVVVAVLPVSGPLVVGAVSGVSGAVMGFGNTAIDLYAIDGELSREDGGRAFIEGLKGGVTGFVTGAVGGVAGKYLSSLTKGIPALQSANTTVNIATHVAVGSASEVATGMTTRAVGEVLEQAMDIKPGIEWSEVGKKALDGGDILKDALIGGAGGYVEGHKLDFSESMYSDYEQGTLKDMYEKGELDYTVDPELDGATFEPFEELTYDMKPKTEKDFADYFEDFTVKFKDDGLSAKERLSLDNILSSDDYANGKIDYDTIMDINKAIDKGKDILGKSNLVHNAMEGGNDGIFKSNDEIIFETNKMKNYS